MSSVFYCTDVAADSMKGFMMHIGAVLLALVLLLQGCTIVAGGGSTSVPHEQPLATEVVVQPLTEEEDSPQLQQPDQVKPDQVSTQPLPEGSVYTIRNIPANLTILVEDRPDILVEVTGRQDVVESIQVMPGLIDGGSWTCKSTFSSHSVGFGGPTFDDCVLSQTTVAVRVPVGTPIMVEGVTGDGTIGDSFARLDLRLTGTSTFQVGTITELGVYNTGTGSTYVNVVQGKVDITLTGTGDITVSKGSSPNAIFNVTGTGDIRVDGVRIDGNATASITGTGSISVGEVAGDAVLSVTGTGGIYVACVRGNTSESKNPVVGEIRVGQCS